MKSTPEVLRGSMDKSIVGSSLIVQYVLSHLETIVSFVCFLNSTGFSRRQSLPSTFEVWKNKS